MQQQRSKGSPTETFELVPELAGHINSQCSEQLFSRMQKHNYFLNTLTTSAHIFLQRNISHHYNVDRKERASRDVNGRITVANYEKLALFAMSFYIHLIWSVFIWVQTRSLLLFEDTHAACGYMSQKHDRK